MIFMTFGVPFGALKSQNAVPEALGSKLEFLGFLRGFPGRPHVEATRSGEGNPGILAGSTTIILA